MTVQIRRGRRVVARGTARLRRGTMTLRLGRSLRRGRYTIVIALTGNDGSKRTLRVTRRL